MDGQDRSVTALDVHQVSYRHDGCAFSRVGVCSIRAQVEGSNPEPFMISK